MARNEVEHDLFKNRQLVLMSHDSLVHSPCLHYPTNLAILFMHHHVPIVPSCSVTTNIMTHGLWPPGYRFHPTDEELVSFYLPNQLEGRRHDLHRVIPLLNVYQHEPWQLPKKGGELCNEDTEQWFFFVPKQEKEVQGGRLSRTTTCGYWKATGSLAYVYSSKSKVIGVKKTMVFYQGKLSKGKKTKWKMNEYRTIKEELNVTNTLSIPKLRHELSLCRVYVV